MIAARSLYPGLEKATDFFFSFFSQFVILRTYISFVLAVCGRITRKIRAAVLR